MIRKILFIWLMLVAPVCAQTVLPPTPGGTATDVVKNFMVYMTDDDHVSPAADGLTLTITASKNGGAFGSITPAVTGRTNGWYSLALQRQHCDTVGDLCLHVIATGVDPTDVKIVVGGVNISHINGGATDGNNADLKLRTLNVTCPNGNAVTFLGLNTGLNGSTGLYCRGYGNGSGIHCEGGTDGISSEGFGVGAGLACTGGKIDILGDHTGATKHDESVNFGPGIDAVSDGNAPGMKLRGGDGEADTLGGGTGSGISSTNTVGSADDGGSWGLEITARGDSAAGAWFKAATGSNAQGASFNGVGSGAGIYSIGGPTGDGAAFFGQGTAHGLKAQALGTGDGFRPLAGTGGIKGVASPTHSGTVDPAGTFNTTTLPLATAANATNNLYEGQVIVLTGGTGIGQTATIKSYAGSTTPRVATIYGTWKIAPAVGTTYEIWPASNILAVASAEPTTVPTATETLAKKIDYLFAGAEK